MLVHEGWRHPLARVVRLLAWSMDGCGEGGDVVVVIVWCCGVCSRVWEFVVSAIERGCSDPTGGGSVYETNEKPLLCCWWVRKDCPCHGCSSLKEGYLYFVFPPVLEGICQHLLSAAYCWVRVTAGCGRPSAVQTRRRYTMPCARKSGISRL